MKKRATLQNDRHRRLFALIKQNWLRLAIAMVCMVIVAGTSSATALLVKPILDDVFMGHDVTMLKLIPIAVVVVYLLKGLALYGQGYFLNYVGLGIIRDLRNQIFERMVELSLSYYHREKTGALMSRITNDVTLIKNMVSNAVTRVLRDGLTIFGLIGVILYRDWKMAILALIFLPFIFYPIFVFGRRVRKVSTGAQESMAELNAFVHETITGNKVVKAFGMEAYETRRFHGKTHHLFRQQVKQVVARELSSPVMEAVAGIGVGFIIWFGGSRVMDGTSTAGTFFSFMTALILLYDPLKKLARSQTILQRGVAAAARVFELLDTRPQIQDKPDSSELAPLERTIEFKKVHFSYGREEVLSGIDLTITAGQIVAIAGRSGGGKTTLVNLLPRFYELKEGRILIDGVDIREVSLKSLRGQIGLVTQQTILFDDTIRANIAYGRPRATPKEIEAAAKAAFAHDFILELPQGYETMIGEQGVRLSGGQRQRLAIARALLKDAPILILDEATSSLDTESEYYVQKAIDNLMVGRTTLVIAHRLSTIYSADRIVVLAGGRIAEEGRHEELIKLDGEYRKLYEMQFNSDQVS